MPADLPEPSWRVLPRSARGGHVPDECLQTPISYTVPDGWANYEDLPGNFLLVPPGGSLDGVDAGTSDYIGIFQGVAVADECARRGRARRGHSRAAEMAAALAAREGLVVTEPVPVEVGGLSGLMIDIDLDPALHGWLRRPGTARADRGR